MTRPKKQTVDYFPHYCNHGKSMFIIEQKYGNDGYVFWFKLLELLGNAEGHCLKLIEDIDWEFLIAKTRLDKEKCNEILNLLASIGSIDKELWNEKIVWSDNFVENIKEAYRNRVTDLPSKPDILRKKPTDNKDNLQDKSTDEMKVDEMKVDEMKGNPVDRTPYEKIKNLYHLNCIKLPEIKEMSDERKKAIRTIWKKYNDISVFEELFKKVSESNFLNGENDNNWRASFDWLMNKKNMIKVLEGNYDNKGGGKNVNNSGNNKRFANEREYEDDDRVESNFYVS